MSIISSSRCRSTGLWNSSESMESCKRFRSSTCTGCYASNSNKRWKNVLPAFNARVAHAWQALSVNEFNAIWQRKKDQTRFRMAKQGECLCDYAHIHNVWHIVLSNPQTLWWIPTRAWKDTLLRQRIDKIRELPNARVMASIDVDYMTRKAVPSLLSDGWKLLFSSPGKQANTPGFPESMFGVPFALCEKTWNADHIKDVCLHCARGCFNRENTHLHWHK